MHPLDLLKTADCLLKNGDGNPTECDLRRAQSAIYYALFHCLARNAADMLVGSDSSTRSNKAWLQVYRALNHNTVFKRCDDALIERFPTTIQEMGYYFKAFQLKRHEADYDPEFRTDVQSTRQDLEFTNSVIEDFFTEREKDLRAFAAYLIIEQRAEKTIKRKRVSQIEAKPIMDFPGEGG